MTRVIVTAVPERSSTVDYLHSHISDLEVVWDQKRSLMDTFLRACELAGNDPAIRLQDDIILTKNFRIKIEQVISQYPNDVIQFFSMRKADLTEGTRWCAGSTYLMNQCFYLPAGISHELISFYWSPAWQPFYESHPTADDSMMAQMFQTSKRRYLLYCPSLVDHQRTRSIVNPKRSTGRQSLTFTDPEYENFPTPPTDN